MRTFIRLYALLSAMNTIAGIDLLARGDFFKPSSPAVQIWSWATTLALGVWAIYVLARCKD